MTFYQLAIRYLKRKRVKTFLLFLVFLFVDSLILGTTMILRAAEEAEASMQKKTGSKVVAEILTENEKITDAHITQLASLEEVVFVNGMAHTSAFPVNFVPVTYHDSTEEDNLKVSVFSYDDLQKDSAFSEQRYRLTDGTYIDEAAEYGAVINAILAEVNGFALGDELELTADSGKTVTVKIIGLFLSGSERKQLDTLASVSRIENQIFIDNHSYSELSGDTGFYKAAVYTENPGQIEKLQAEVEQILQGKAKVTTSDTLFEQMKAPLEQLARAARLMMILTFVTGTIVISLLLCMWMRTRQTETAVFISLGKTKCSILFQLLLEAIIVFTASVAGAGGTGWLMAKVLRTMIVDSEEMNIALDIFMRVKDILCLFGIGGAIVFLAVILSVFPVLKSNPKDTLSKMEG